MKILSKFLSFKSKPHLIVISFFLVVFTLAILSINDPKVKAAQGPDNSECLSCHEDSGLKGKKNGKTISVFINEKKLKSSVHHNAACTDCHVDLKNADLPHDDDLKPAQCSNCHKDAVNSYQIGLHGQAAKKGDPLAPKCTTCHGSAHEMLLNKDPRSPVHAIKIPSLCGKCHREGSPVQLQRNIPQSHIIENYTESIHGKGLLEKGLAVTATCASCHSPHLILPHTDNRSSISRNNIAKTCTKCHAMIEEVHKKVINGQKWEKESHVLPACVDCHQPHKIRKVFYAKGLANEECMSCHSKPNIKSSKDGHLLHVDHTMLSGSVHNKVACSQCHTDVYPSKNRPCESIKSKVNCASCHENIGKDYMQGTHGELATIGDKDSPVCKTCHGDHNILAKSNPNSKVFPANIPKLCSQCHMDGKKAAVRIKDEQHILQNYSESMHGKGLNKSGLTVTATCADCHTPHKQLHHTKKESSTSDQNISKTCGNCHYGIEKIFEKSIHSKLVSKSKNRLPVCKDCHKAHSVADTKGDKFRMDVMKTCGKCHKQITETYFDTYHGKASQLGSKKSAKCFDCHGSHDILPPSFDESHLSRHNVVETCQKCHKQANRKFAGYLTHATHHDPDKYPLLFIVFWAMTSLLIGTFVVSWIHTLLWLPMSLKMRKQAKLLHKEHPNDKRVMRFSPLNRALHMIMVTSFLTLAFTGMLLKFAYTDWAKFMVDFVGGGESAGIIHRVGALMLIGVFVVHVFDLFRKKKEEFGSWKSMLFGPDSLVPNKKDWEDVKGSMKWFIGKGPRPDYGRWTYWEKFDYFAVFWGIFVIGSTGMSLWFPAFFTKLIPGEFLNIATIIHSDEALLAAGFIFTVHFFNTHFRPEKFPMDTVVFTGSYSLEEFKLDRPDEYRRLEESGELEKIIVPPPTKAYETFVRIFGWGALITGLIIVVFIIYSMLFYYK